MHQPGPGRLPDKQHQPPLMAYLNATPTTDATAMNVQMTCLIGRTRGSRQAILWSSQPPSISNDTLFAKDGGNAFLEDEKRCLRLCLLSLQSSFLSFFLQDKVTNIALIAAASIALVTTKWKTGRQHPLLKGNRHLMICKQECTKYVPCVGPRNTHARLSSWTVRWKGTTFFAQETIL